MFGYLIAPWALMDKLRTAIARHGLRLTALEEHMAADRDLLNKLLTALPATLAKVREVITENQSLRAENAQLKGDAAADEAADVEALRPLEAALNALDAAVTPAAAEEPDVTPVEDVADVPAAVDPAAGDQPA